MPRTQKIKTIFPGWLLILGFILATGAVVLIITALCIGGVQKGSTASHDQSTGVEITPALDEVQVEVRIVDVLVEVTPTQAPCTEAVPIVFEYQCYNCWNENLIDTLARLLAGLPLTTWEKAALVWLVLNRVDSPRFPNDVIEVIGQPREFDFYGREKEGTFLDKLIVEDVLNRWLSEYWGWTQVGRLIPENYLFMNLHEGSLEVMTEIGGEPFGWTLPNPYTREDWQWVE